MLKVLGYNLGQDTRYAELFVVYPSHSREIPGQFIDSRASKSFPISYKKRQPSTLKPTWSLHKMNPQCGGHVYVFHTSQTAEQLLRLG
jgi:hypothetical protein